MISSEFEIIRRYFAESGLQFARNGISLGIGDDAALVEVPVGRQLALSMDVLVEGIHFPAQADAALIAQRALAVNLSDMAAMGAEPLCFTLGLTMPAVDPNWMASFSAGLLVLGQEFNCPLVGGDLSRGPLNIAIQVQGLVAANGAIRRQGARPGDQIYVSGNLGDGAIALASMGLSTQLGADFVMEPTAPCADFESYFIDAFYKPQPRVKLGLALTGLVSSGIDISDGLAGDLGHILRASGVGAVINSASIPYSEAAVSCMNASNRELAALYGGDDYELCVTVAPDNCTAAEAAAAASGTRFSRIGEIVSGSALYCVDNGGQSREVEAAAFQHFRSQDRSQGLS